ncbi:MAG: hypothetical protein ACYC4Q_11525, partial [Victivallaceae bacterium]
MIKSKLKQELLSTLLFVSLKNAAAAAKTSYRTASAAELCQQPLLQSAMPMSHLPGIATAAWFPENCNRDRQRRLNLKNRQTLFSSTFCFR